jgi:hypothetical protein
MFLAVGMLLVAAAMRAAECGERWRGSSIRIAALQLDRSDWRPTCSIR